MAILRFLTFVFSVACVASGVLFAQPDGKWRLWDETVELPASADVPLLPNTRFSVIKPYDFAGDGYRFLHGVALCFHQGKLFATFGHNRGGENTDTEEARWCVSLDMGLTWSDVRTIDSGPEPGVGVSHGTLLSLHGTLWAFQAAYRGTMEDVHTRAYRFNETQEQWVPLGTVIESGFWPMQRPIRMDSGDWIMAGLRVGGDNPAIVAISDGDDLRSWNVVEIPQAHNDSMWGESTVIVDKNRVTCISRFGAQARALVAHSDDYGRSWSEMVPSNLLMATSKPYAGTLSTGQHYLVCTTTSDSGKRRSPLTIAVSEPGKLEFNRVFKIRDAEFAEGPGESHPRAALSYPYAIEQDGNLYVGFSNNGGNQGRVGEGRQLWNNNSAELAVIRIEDLLRNSQE